uniref:Uncharacterized protein n=1 Tax=Aplanochytrium stocchinoi TaxID=215587 RepID=A0A7S3V2X7_9STRA
MTHNLLLSLIIFASSDSNTSSLLVFISIKLNIFIFYLVSYIDYFAYNFNIMPSTKQVWDGALLIDGPYAKPIDAYYACQKGIEYLKMPGTKARRKYQEEKKEFKTSCSCRDDECITLDFVYDRRSEGWYAIYREPKKQDNRCRCFQLLHNLNRAFIIMYDPNEKLIYAYSGKFDLCGATKATKLEAIRIHVEKANDNPYPKEYLEQVGIAVPEKVLMEIE